MGHTYQLTARIEGGEVSELFRGLQDHGREVSLKVFSPRLSDPEYGRALIEAAKKIGALGEPTILPFEDVGVAEGRLCCVRAHVDGFHLGMALTRLATKEVVLPAPVALQIAIEAMGAVAAAHRAGLVHGALTPANIFVGRDGRVFVTDFLALWAMRQSQVLRPLAERGRKAYRAPELARGFEADAAGDVYSLGAILYELLTLREVAASRGGGVSTRRDVLTPPSRLDRRVNARLDPLVMRALEPLKSRRHKNAQDMAEAFRGYLVAQGGVPGREELAKFVRELFPNELSVTGSTSDLPFTREFTLEPAVEGVSLPGIGVDVAERASYSLSAVDVLAEETALHDAEPEPVARPRAVSEWEAPPGALDPAVLRKLSDPARKPLEIADTQPLARDEVQQLLTREGPLARAESRTDVNTSPRSAEELLGGMPTLDGPPPPAPLGREAEPRKIPGAERASRQRRALDDPYAPPPKRERPDWRVKYEPPPPPPKPKTPLSHWALAVGMAAGAAALTYLAASHRTHAERGVPSPPVHALPQPDPAVTPKEPAHPQPAHRAEPRPVVITPHKPVSYCLSLEADVPQATVRIDGSAPLPLPLSSAPVGPGDHELIVAGHGHMRRLHVTEAVTRAPCVLQTVLLGHRRGRLAPR